MIRVLVKLAMAALVAGVLSPRPTVAQELPPAKKAENLKIIKGPELELAIDGLVIVRWTSTNPGGDDEHYGVVHYGTGPNDLSQTAKSHIRLNRLHPETIFRVRMPGLRPETTYYYWVSSVGANGAEDGVKSAVSQFTTPSPGQRVINFPQPK